MGSRRDGRFANRPKSLKNQETAGDHLRAGVFCQIRVIRGFAFYSENAPSWII